MTEEEQDTWHEFLAAVAKKTKSTAAKITKLSAALNNTPIRPTIYLLHGIHGNMLFPDLGYCEFDDPSRVWEHLQRWARITAGSKGKPSTWKDCFPTGFEVGIVSLDELSKTYPVWELLKQAGAEIINPLYSQPYMRHACEESNVRELEVGINVLGEHELQARVFASSEHALHPQMPQLLRAFGIELAYTCVRLAGGAPTSYNPKVIWEGIDGTTIPSIVSQSGLPNGHVWHGKFFEELPSLIFSAVARPDLADVVYVNIEDFANPMPGSSEVASHVSEFERERIFLRSFQDLAENKISVSNQVRWSIEDFPIRLMYSKLIALARRCDDFLVLVEAADSLLTAFGSESHERMLENAWKNLLAAQNHDAYIVPFTIPGMYSDMQGIEQTKTWNSEETIEDRSARLVTEATNAGKAVLDEISGIDQDAREPGACLPEGVAVLNMLWSRAEVICGRVYEMPALGYSSASMPVVSSRNVNVEGQSIVYADHEFEIGQRPFTVTHEHPAGILIDADRYTARLIDSGTRLEILLKTNIPLEIAIKTQKDAIITYPFGAEKTTERMGHALRFAWLDDELVVSHKGTPYFKQENGKFKIQVPAGEHTFAFDQANSLLDAYQRAWEFFYPPVPFLLKEGQHTSGKFYDISFNGTIPSSFRLKYGSIFARFFSIDGSIPYIHDAIPIDFHGNETEPIGAPWRIYNYKLPLAFNPE
ncbi:MAG TPA: hypothetical protein VKM55_18980 [Candidatus Lokiarchaeia archaeon]|nr:hypothetical protein [Candidatus Lokiarchaeia archaeon]